MTLHMKTRLIKHGNLGETGFVKGLQTVCKEFPKGFCSSLVIFYFKEEFFVSLASACPIRDVYFQSVPKTLCKK